MNVRRRFEDGNDIAVFYDFVSGPPIGTMRMSEWFTLENGTIKAITLYFDATFMRQMEEQAAQKGSNWQS